MTRSRMVATMWAALAGVVSAGALLAVAELAALLVAPATTPLLAVGGFVIDIVPQQVKEFAIAAFGANDKLVLVASLGLAAAVGAGIAGVVQLRRPPWGIVLLALAGTASSAAVVTRAGASGLWLIPPVIATAAGCGILAVLVGRLRAWVEAESPMPRAVARRTFLLAAAAAAASAIVVGAGARLANGARTSIDGARRALRLPVPGRTVPIPAGADLGIPGLSPLFTPNADFYRVDTALEVPRIDPAQWRLVVDGLVDTPLELTLDDVIGRGIDEYAITLTCVSNEVGGDLVGTALWWGVPVRDILRMAGPRPGADMVLSRSIDGFTASTPLSALTDDGRDAILAVAMNGEPLPLEHGFPVRMVVPGLYGYVSATKWLTRLTVTTFAQDEAYWTPRGYAAQAPIKFSSRIDTPRPGAVVEAGEVVLAGVAWAQTAGISRVEVRVDDEAWQTAQLSAPVSADTWVQWAVRWNATPGTHYVTVRAIDGGGVVQESERAPIAPDGATGWQRVLVTVR